MGLALPGGLAVVLAVLVLVQLLNNNRRTRHAYLVTSLAATAVLLTVFRLGNLSWADAGLGGAGLAEGARWLPVLVGLTALGYLGAVLLPATRRLFLDRRAEDARPATAAYQVLVRIPLGTVVLEEVAFRGVLYGLLSHLSGTAWATTVSSVLFGLWHIPPSRDLPRLNTVAARMPAALLVPAAVLVTALAGVLLCEVRRRSGGLLAPIALHWAINAFAYLTAFAVTRRGRRRGWGVASAPPR
jgi:uncharacterized protein